MHLKPHMGKLALLTAGVLLTAQVAYAQTTGSANLEQAIAIINNIQFMMIIVLVVIGMMVIAGGLMLFLRLRQLDRVTREQRTRLAEIQALYKELQGARKRTESALNMISGKSAELNNTRVEIDATVRDALARMTQSVALLPVGERQYHAQDYGGALTTYTRAAELDDNNPLVHYRAGYTSIQVAQLDRAMAHLRRALEIDPAFAPAQAAMGYLYRRMGEAHESDENHRTNLYNDAERYLNEALRTSRRLLDEDGEAWMGTVAGLYRRRRQFDRALKLYAEAAEVTPFASYPYASMALVYADKNDYAQMFKSYERVEWRARNEVSARPTSPWGHANLLLARLALGRDDRLVEEEFTLMFLSIPKEGGWLMPTVNASLRRLEWALSSAQQQERAERVAQLIQRIQRLEPQGSIYTTGVMRGNQDIIRTTSAMRTSSNGDQPPPPPRRPSSAGVTRQLGSSDDDWT